MEMTIDRLKEGDIVILNDTGYYEVPVTGVTKAMIKIKHEGKERMFRKQASGWHSAGSAYGRNNYGSIKLPTPELLEEVKKTKERALASAQAAAERRTEKEKDEALQQAWLKSEAGIAQTNRYNYWEGLDIDVYEDPDNYDLDTRRRYARVILVGPYQRRHSDTPDPRYSYVEATITQGVTWGERREDLDSEEKGRATVYMLESPEISMYSLSGDVRRIPAYLTLLGKVQAIANEWAKDTGKQMVRYYKPEVK